MSPRAHTDHCQSHLPFRPLSQSAISSPTSSTPTAFSSHHGHWTNMIFNCSKSCLHPDTSSFPPASPCAVWPLPTPPYRSSQHPGGLLLRTIDGYFLIPSLSPDQL